MGGFAENYNRAEGQTKQQNDILLHWFTETAKLKQASVW
jgi:hypothetical protein